ncbi:MAG: hypothetical protein L0Y72_01715 [Gemmataceae bacterium]|nr:hypothetical protein [Gemmataceae bacterium]MCI0737732.1 hypothetical protein [Gemmataceae bacterium]
MAIVFTGGTVRNDTNPVDPPLMIDNQLARDAAWNDFRDGLTQEEQRFFELNPLPNGRGQLGLTDPDMNAGAPIHEDVRLLIEETRNEERTIHIMPVPVYNQTAPAWILEFNRGDSDNVQRFEINGYAHDFPREFLGMWVFGRTHRMRRSGENAIVYATRFAPVGIDPHIVDTWDRPILRPIPWREEAGLTPGIWIDRHSTIVLFHELVFHAIRGVFAHRICAGGAYDAAGVCRAGVERPHPRLRQVERRARDNWTANHP